MQIPKEKVLDFLREQGKGDQVDPEQHAGLLKKFGIDPGELLSKFGGGALGGEIPGL